MGVGGTDSPGSLPGDESSIWPYVYSFGNLVNRPPLLSYTHITYTPQICYTLGSRVRWLDETYTMASNHFVNLVRFVFFTDLSPNQWPRRLVQLRPRTGCLPVWRWARTTTPTPYVQTHQTCCRIRVRTGGWRAERRGLAGCEEEDEEHYKVKGGEPPRHKE